MVLYDSNVLLNLCKAHFLYAVFGHDCMYSSRILALWNKIRIDQTLPVFSQIAISSAALEYGMACYFVI
jgi:hypothetical protein